MANRRDNRDMDEVDDRNVTTDTGFDDTDTSQSLGAAEDDDLDTVDMLSDEDLLEEDRI